MVYCLKNHVTRNILFASEMGEYFDLSFPTPSLLDRPLASFFCFNMLLWCFCICKNFATTIAKGNLFCTYFFYFLPLTSKNFNKVIFPVAVIIFPSLYIPIFFVCSLHTTFLVSEITGSNDDETMSVCLPLFKINDVSPNLANLSTTRRWINKMPTVLNIWRLPKMK